MIPSRTARRSRYGGARTGTVFWLVLAVVALAGVLARLAGYSDLGLPALGGLCGWFAVCNLPPVRRVLLGASGHARVPLRTALDVLTWSLPIAYLSGWGPALIVLSATVVLRELDRRPIASVVWTAVWIAAGVAAGQWATGTGRIPDRIPGTSGLELCVIGCGLAALTLTAAARLGSRAERAGAERDATAQYFHTISLDSSSLLCVIDARYRLVHVSASVERITGRRASELLGRNPEAFVSSDDAGVFGDLCRRLKNTHGDVCLAEYRLVQADGSTRWYEVSARNLLDDRRVRGIVLDHRDITDRREYQQRLVHEASHDALTGLANRAHLWRELDAVFATPRSVGMLFVDLDGFKPINDTLGHHAGDEVLVQVAQVLKASVRADDVVARLGGDEFGVLLRDVTGPADVEAAARTVRAHFAAPWIVTGRSVRVGASIGTAVRSYNCLTAADLMSRADAAMYDEKRGSARSVGSHRAPDGRATDTVAPSV